MEAVMAYDRYDPQERRWREDDRGPRGWDRDDRNDRRGQDEPGFFEKMGNEVRSWFGDEDDRDDTRERHRRADRDDDYTRGYRWPSSERDYNPRYQQELNDRGYRPIAGG